MKRHHLIALTMLVNFAVLPSPAAAKTKKSKKPVATMEAKPPRVVIYDPAFAAGPATFSELDEPAVPHAPLITVTTDKDAGKGVAEEKDVALEKGKKAK